MEGKGLRTLVPEPRSWPLPLLPRGPKPPRVWHLSPSPTGKPVFIPSGPRPHSLGVVKLIGGGYGLFPGNAFFIF